MATATLPKPRTKKPAQPRAKQQHFEGMAPEKNPKIERLAERYREARDERMRMGEEERDAKELLRIALKEAGLKRYEWDGKFAEFTQEENVKVGTIKKEKTDA